MKNEFASRSTSGPTFHEQIDHSWLIRAQAQLVLQYLTRTTVSAVDAVSHCVYSSAMSFFKNLAANACCGT